MNIITYVYYTVHARIATPIISAYEVAMKIHRSIPRLGKRR